LIAPTWVLSATHCGHRPGAEFCVPADNDRPDYPNRCVRAIRVVDNPQADQTLLELAQPMTDVAPEVVPVAIQAEPLDRSWVGRTAEAAGYGQVQDGGFNERWFTAEIIARVGEPYLTIDGQGERGVCFGDSGGPVFLLGDDGQVRVAGDLSHGDPSCTGQDNYTRTDLFADWIEGYTGPTGPADVGPQPCGMIDAVGRCDGAVAAWCDDGVLARERCDTCGWSDRAGGFRCLQGNDPCLGYDRAGACDGSVARWCENGVARARDCGACGQGCVVQDGLGAGCTEDPCAGLDYLGRCDGDQAVWCDDQGFHTVDCGDQGASCGYVNDRVGYYCQ
ncbi:MAG: trypsin-like serine protease, partial [Myxococcales bacterium]|nr:trypsin-like serine protease [Myxococcales bacterium]